MLRAVCNHFIASSKAGKTRALLTSFGRRDKMLANHAQHSGVEVGVDQSCAGVCNVGLTVHTFVCCCFLAFASALNAVISFRVSSEPESECSSKFCSRRLCEWWY